MITVTQEAQARQEAEAQKNYRERGAHDGPSRPLRPGRLMPAEVDRGYLDPGHAAPSPEHGMPRQPVVPLRPGVPTPVSLSPQVGVGGYEGPIAESAAAHSALALGVPAGGAR